MELSKEFQRHYKQKMLTPRILWGGLTFSVIIYIGVVYIVVAGGEATPPMENSGMVLNVLYGAGIMMAVASSFIRGFLFNPVRIKQQLSTPLDDSDFKGSEEEKRLMGLIPWGTAPFIIVLALGEGVVILGVVGSFLTHKTDPVMMGALITIILNIFTLLTFEGMLKRGMLIIDKFPELITGEKNSLL